MANNQPEGGLFGTYLLSFSAFPLNSTLAETKLNVKKENSSSIISNFFTLSCLCMFSSSRNLAECEAVSETVYFE